MTGLPAAWPRPVPSAPRSISRSSSSSKPRCGTPSRRSPTAARARRRPSCSTTPAARSSPGSALRISGPTRRGRSTWSCRRASPARRSSRSSTPWRSTAATRRRRFLPDIARVYQTVDRSLPSAELRPPLPRPRARSRGAGQLVQSARRRTGRPPRHRQPAPSAARGRLHLARPERRVLRARPRARQRRRDPARARQRLPRAGERRRLAAMALARRGAPESRRSPAVGSPPPARPRWCSTSSTTRSRASRASASRRRSIFPFPSPRRPAPAGTSPTTGRWA